MTAPARTRPDLAEFLRARRLRLSPAEAGLPSGTRRRTPGLRREEVAALAGVGLTWYTWLEQGRDIGVSAVFLDNLARVLKLDAGERRHLYLLAHQRPPSEPGYTWCQVPPLVTRLMHDLPARPAYVLNLRWDILAWNTAAERIFGFGGHVPQRRNLLWLLYVEPSMRTRIADWPVQAPRMLSSFRRDYTRAPNDPDVVALVDELLRVAPEFREGWGRHEIHAPCEGTRQLCLDGMGPLTFGHGTLVVDEERHLRLVVYEPVHDAGREQFTQWLAQPPCLPLTQPTPLP